MERPFETIEVDVAKLRDYCLSDSHPRGRHNARVFRYRLGLTAADSEALRESLLRAVDERWNELIATEADEYGQRYVLDFLISVRPETADAKPRSSMVRSAWSY